jgi:hypothetical protein
LKSSASIILEDIIMKLTKHRKVREKEGEIGNMMEGWACSKHMVHMYGIITVKPSHITYVC